MPYGVIENETAAFRGSVNGVPNSPVTWTMRYKTRTGTVTSGYRRKVANNQKLPVNDYQCMGYTCGPTAGVSKRGPYWDGNKYTTDTIVAYPSQIGSTITSLSLDWTLLAKARAACQNKVADGNANFGQFFAERKQVYSLVTNTVRRIANVRKTLADYATGLVKHEAVVRKLEEELSTGRRKFRLHDIKDFNRKYRKFSWYRKEFDSRKLSGNLASDWLAVQYGVRPLLADVEDFARHFAQKALDAEKDPEQFANRLLKFTGRAKLERQTRETMGTGFLDVERKNEARCTMVFRVSMEYLRTAQTTGILNLAALGWELLPYSFVVDWFADVGDYLKRLSYNSGLTFVEGFYSEKAQASYRGEFSAGFTVISPMRTSGTAFNVRRSRFTSPPFAERPTMNNDPVSLVRFLNTLALLRQQEPSSEREWSSSSVRKLR